MSLESLTRAIRASFRVLRLQAEAGRERFGNFTRTFANAVRPHLKDFYGQLAVKPDTRDAVMLAIEQRSLLMADSVLDTSAERLGNGDRPRDVFSLDRAASIAVTEASYAINEAKLMRAKARNKRIGWRLGGKACEVCKRLARLTVVPGKPFVSGKVSVLAPPAHVNCRCVLYATDVDARGLRG